MMIISHPPSPILDNIFFAATKEKVETDNGRLWIEALKKHSQQFLEMRSLELRLKG